MPSPLDRAEAALLPLHGLAVLAGQRCREDVHVVIDGEQAWVTWPAGEEAVWRALLAVPGIAFFERRGGRWQPLGRHLPRFDLPLAGEPRRLDALLSPAPLRAEAAPAEVGRAGTVRLVPSQQIRPTSALRVAATELLSWAESAPTVELRACSAALAAGRVLLIGQRLPAVPAAQRFWGRRALVPLGLRPEPDLPESALRAAAEVGPDELLLLTEAGTEVVPESALAPLTRAALRAACGVAQGTT